jgi:phage shock protein PspC (stress-responsive transcriptional regulator)
MYRLRKTSKKDSKFLGVCGGISKYLDPDSDPTIVRLIWVIMTLFSPLMIFLYFILALVLKPENYEYKEEKFKDKS